MQFGFLKTKLRKIRQIPLHHMLDSKKKNSILPYAELITIFFTYTDYDFREEEPKFMHTKIGKMIVSKLG